VVLFELLAGRTLFQGEDLTETLASVVKEEPRLEGIPPQVRRLLRSCLEKDPKKRLRDIGDALRLLDEPAEPQPALHKRRARWLWPCVAAVALLAAASLAVADWLRKPAKPGVVMFTIEAPAEHMF
jgi:eukaryotic-like serine/threonine-protein kinase